jgi:RNA polymerase sigma-70 factor, ECF subfamily
MNQTRERRLLDRAEESALVVQAKQGDFEAFDQLVRHCERKVWTVVWRLLGEKEETENVVQVAFLKALEALETFRGDSSFCTWVGRIATRAGLDVLRSRKRKENLSLDELALDEDDEGSIAKPGLIADWREDPSASVERSELRLILDQALDELSPTLRAVFVLRDVQGLSTEEAAQELGITVGNAKVRLLRARLALRERLTKTFGGEEMARAHIDGSGLGGLAAAGETDA